MSNEKASEGGARAPAAAKQPTKQRKEKKPRRQRPQFARTLGREKRPMVTECQNCGATLTGDYCAVCGQARKEPRRAVIGLVQDVIVDTFAIDGKLIRSFLLLLFSPGKLADRFLAGQRVRYTPPFRMFLFWSVLFFFAAFAAADTDGLVSTSDEPLPADVQELVEEAQAAAEDGELPPELQELVEEVAAASADEASGDDSQGLDINIGDDGEFWGPVGDRLEEAARRVQEDPRLFIAHVKENLPRFLLLAPLIFGTLLVLLYFYRRSFLIYDHFVVSLYTHGAMYAYFTVATLMSLWSPLQGFIWVPIVWGVAQSFLIMRTAYGSPWWSLIPKWIFIMSLYLVSVTALIAVGLGYSLWQS